MSLQQDRSKKLVLCLHGARQTAEIFQNQISKLIDALADLTTFEFLDAPFLLPLLTPQDSVRTRSWCRPVREVTADSTAHTEETVTDFGEDHVEDDLERRYSDADKLLDERMQRAPYPDILLGFSQGGLMIYRYLMRCSGQMDSPVQAIIFAATPDPSKMFCRMKNVPTDATKHHTSRVNPSSNTGGCFLNDISSLHIIGRKDQIVPPTESIHFAASCGPNAEVLFHEHSHTIPQLQVLFSAVRGLIKRSTKHPELGQAFNEEQANELEIISVMYGAQCIDTPTQSVGTRVTLPLFDEHQLLDEPHYLALARLRLRFRLPSEYPMVAPSLSIVGGPTAKGTGFERWSTNLVERCMGYLLQNHSCSQTLLAVRMFANEEATQSIPFLQRVLGTHSANLGPESETGLAELGDENMLTAGSHEDDAKRLEYFLEAEEKVTLLQQRMACFRTETGQAAHDSTETGMQESLRSEGLASQRSGGTWTPVIGLIGKPSAGKSTFFNAITNPQSETEAARVAAFPFTTIQPNVGTGFGPIQCPCVLLARANERTQPHTGAGHPSPDLGVEKCDACYGHVTVRGRARYRRHSILVKDVAGLVQGAYQGKGKGNQFLSDLCDASVLVHVVDAAGSTDASGSPCAPGQGSTLEDITWVRKEVHDWIYDNLRAKWASILRAPKKIRTMFSGYRASVSFVDEILQLMGIANDTMLQTQLKTWGPVELHLLVALFIRLRFPIVVALNKADLSTAKDVIEELYRRYPNENFVCMSAKVECDLLTLERKGLVEYSPGASNFVDRSEGVNVLSKRDAERLRYARVFFDSFNSGKYQMERSASRPVSDPGMAFSMSSTGIQDVIANAIERVACVHVYPVAVFPPAIPSLKHCLLFRPGITVEEVFWAMVYKNIIHGKFCRFEILDIGKRSKAPIVLRKTEVLPNSTLLVRVLTNKRQLA